MHLRRRSRRNLLADFLGYGLVSADLTESGKWSAWASRMLTCQACVSDKLPRNPGIPVNRIPCTTFQ